MLEQFSMMAGTKDAVFQFSDPKPFFAQFSNIFHFWKNVTKGKMLWVRNNFSTFTSQFVDTFAVLFLLCSFEIISWDLFTNLLISGFLFKVLIAILDTPFLYLAVYYFQKRFNLARGEELNLD